MFALVYQPLHVGSFIDIVAIFLSYLAEGLNTDGQSAFGHNPFSFCQTASGKSIVEGIDQILQTLFGEFRWILIFQTVSEKFTQVNTAGRTDALAMRPAVSIIVLLSQQ